MSAAELFDANTRLAYWVVKRMRRSEKWRHEDEEEMVQDALFGLWHACQRFDPAAGFKFSSYAERCIKGYVLVGYGRRAGSNRRQGRDGVQVSYDEPRFTGTGSWVDDLPADCADPEDEGTRRALVAAVLDLLASDDFDHLDRVALATTQERGSLRRVASELGINHETLRQRALKVQRRLRSRLGRVA